LEDGRLEQAKDAFGLSKKCGTFTRQFDMPSRPVEQPHSHATLEILNRSRQRRLRDTNRYGGLTEVQLISDRYEMAQLAQLWRADTHYASNRAQ
jgi:hypothetical protein